MIARLQWVALATVALLAAAWANGVGTVWGMIGAGLFGAAAGWVIAGRVLP